MFAIKVAHFVVDVIGLVLLAFLVVYLASKFGDIKSIMTLKDKQEDWTDDVRSAPRDGRPILVRVRAWNKSDGQLLERVAWWVGGGWKEFPSRENTLWQPVEWKDLPE